MLLCVRVRGTVRHGRPLIVGRIGAGHPGEVRRRSLLRDRYAGAMPPDLLKVRAGPADSQAERSRTDPQGLPGGRPPADTAPTPTPPALLTAQAHVGASWWAILESNQ